LTLNQDFHSHPDPQEYTHGLDPDGNFALQTPAPAARDGLETHLTDLVKESTPAISDVEAKAGKSKLHWVL
jgi:hypothetical protein